MSITTDGLTSASPLARPGVMHTPRVTWEGPKGYSWVGGDGAAPCIILCCHASAVHPAGCGGMGSAHPAMCRHPHSSGSGCVPTLPPTLPTPLHLTTRGTLLCIQLPGVCWLKRLKTPGLNYVLLQYSLDWGKGLFLRSYQMLTCAVFLNFLFQLSFPLYPVVTFMKQNLWIWNLG